MSWTEKGHSNKGFEECNEFQDIFLGYAVGRWRIDNECVDIFMKRTTLYILSPG